MCKFTNLKLPVIIFTMLIKQYLFLNRNYSRENFKDVHFNLSHQIYSYDYSSLYKLENATNLKIP